VRVRTKGGKYGFCFKELEFDETGACFGRIRGGLEVDVLQVEWVEQFGLRGGW
jgi:hypothetical protein